MRVRLTKAQAKFLLDQLDIWIEGYKDITDEMPSDVVLELLRNRETAETIREKIWRRLRK